MLIIGDDEDDDDDDDDDDDSDDKSLDVGEGETRGEWRLGRGLPLTENLTKKTMQVGVWCGLMMWFDTVWYWFVICCCALL